MTQVTHPPKEAVRKLLAKHREDRTPLDPEQIKRELGWRLIEAEQAEATRREAMQSR